MTTPNTGEIDEDRMINQIINQMEEMDKLKKERDELKTVLVLKMNVIANEERIRMHYVDKATELKSQLEFKEKEYQALEKMVKSQARLEDALSEIANMRPHEDAAMEMKIIAKECLK